jgi:8-oxo-dGTP pyrophosphatase MutT (NUDIX family)
MAHIHEKIDWTVTVFIVCGGKVLVRKHEKYHIWLGVGGHIELYEDPIQAGKRECLEEVGLVVEIGGEEQYKDQGDDRTNIPPPAFLNRHHVSEVHEHIDFIYFAQSESNVVVPENETDSWLWLTKEEVLQHPEISETIKKYAVAALDFYIKPTV